MTAAGDWIELGFFVHDVTTGRPVRQGKTRAVRNVPWATFSADLAVPWGAFQLAVEGRVIPAHAAG